MEVGGHESFVGVVVGGGVIKVFQFDISTFKNSDNKDQRLHATTTSLDSARNDLREHTEEINYYDRKTGSSSTRI